jgi:four helix bundle protein
MNEIRRFEDLIAWQKARGLTRAIYHVTGRGKFSSDFGLSRQIQRAAVSVMANIAEGFERGGRGEFHQFLSTAKASCAEVRSHLYVALDAGYLDQQAFNKLLDRAEEIARILGGLRSSVGRQKESRQGKTQSSVLSPQS